MIDVSELLLDPDFVEPSTIVVLRRTSTVGTTGRNVLAETINNVIAVVQAGNGETLKRLPESAQLSDWITVYSKFVFTADGTGQYPDIVQWNGKRYSVQLKTDYSNWGEGYTRADCLIEGGGNG